MKKVGRKKSIYFPASLKPEIMFFKISIYMKDLSQGIGGRTVSFSCGSLWAYPAFKPKISLWFYVQEDHILDKYLYLICNPLKIKILLLLAHLSRRLIGELIV